MRIGGDGVCRAWARGLSVAVAAGHTAQCLGKAAGCYESRTTPKLTANACSNALKSRYVLAP